MIELGKKNLTLEIIKKIIFKNEPIKIDKSTFSALEKSYKLAQSLSVSKQAIYGLTTGFGAFAEKKISPLEQKALQENIILSHAVGVHEPLDFFIAKTMLLFRLNTLIQGYSLASPHLIDALVKLLNANCAPVVPKKGSVGASGDLAPLAHLGLLLLGFEDGLHNGKKVTAKQALKEAKITNFSLGIRDGLALINGTQAMAASGINAIIKSQHLCNLADLAGSITLEALGGHEHAFDLKVHNLKPHEGQIQTAKNILNLTKNSTRHKNITNLLTQDPYSLRCIPQVHGASRDVTKQNLQTIEKEINSVTDNPLFFLKKNGLTFDIFSGGNFHGQHIALALDYQAMAIAELANIAERRLELLLNPRHSNGLPAFLISNGGINSGYMMLHVTASALVNENKILTHPASTDSIPTSAGREDHVSMGMSSANKLWQIIENTHTVLAIEIMAGLQALDFRKEKYAGEKIQSFYQEARKITSFKQNDCLFIKELKKISDWLNSDIAENFIEKLINA